MVHHARLLSIWDALSIDPVHSSERSRTGAEAVSSNGSSPRETTEDVGLHRRTRRPVQFSLFYFDGKEGASAGDKYRLLVEGAKFADENGFTAVWTPERHFHEFGGLYPNPAITSAALAMITRQVQIRAGSVVVPLHNNLRVAEEWAAVDNLSHGRVGISFASGWHADDFALAPENYSTRKAKMIAGIDALRRLWRGEVETTTNGLGKTVELRTFPKPVQAELPVWVTCSGNPETFILAGEVGGGVLTHLLGQSLDELREKIALYRQTLARCGHEDAKGTVTLMMHTFIGEHLDEVREKVRRPFCEYLASSIDLIQRQLLNAVNEVGDNGTPWRKQASLRSDRAASTVQTTDLTTKEKEELAAYGFDRYFNTAALFGTPETCLKMVHKLAEIGVDEIACLIDFGVDVDTALDGLIHLNALRKRYQAESDVELIEERPLSDVEQLDLSYWTRQLENSPISNAHSSPAGYRISGPLVVSTELVPQLDQLTARNGVTLFILLLTAFQVLLHRYAGLDDISVGTCFFTGNSTEAATDDELVNTLVLRAQITDDVDFGDLLEQSRGVAVDALAHHHLPFHRLNEHLQTTAASPQAQLFRDAFLFLDSAPSEPVNSESIIDILHTHTGLTGYNSVLAIWRNNDMLSGVFCCNAADHDAEIVERMPAHFQTLLQSVATDSRQPISELALISSEESFQLSSDFNASF
ncbi:MAG TPA: MupA/Atu3671 family FMN-dependent luciferase-like monooxygenase [Pyrinomonadaceae bacterium]